jgi:hypothetical protein
MALHAFTAERRHRPPAAWIGGSGILQLGALHFLLLVGILMGLLALIALVFLVQLSSA